MSKKLLCIMCCLFTTLTTFSQNKEESLSTPELFDFVLSSTTKNWRAMLQTKEW